MTINNKNLNNYKKYTEIIFGNEDIISKIIRIDSIIKSSDSIDEFELTMLKKVRAGLLNHLNESSISNDLAYYSKKNYSFGNVNSNNIQDCIINLGIINKLSDEAYAATIYSLIDDIDEKINESKILEAKGKDSSETKRSALLLNSYIEKLLDIRALPTTDSKEKQLAYSLN